MSLPSSVDSAPGEYSPDVQHRVCTKALVQLQKEISCVVAFLLEPVLGGAQEVPYWICKLPIFCWIPVVAFWWHYLVASGYPTCAEALSLYLGLLVLMLLYAVLMELRNIADLLRTHKTQLDILIEPHLPAL